MMALVRLSSTIKAFKPLQLSLCLCPDSTFPGSQGDLNFNRECSADIFLALHSHMTAHVLGDFFNNCKAKASPAEAPCG